MSDVHCGFSADQTEMHKNWGFSQHSNVHYTSDNKSMTAAFFPVAGSKEMKKSNVSDD